VNKPEEIARARFKTKSFRPPQGDVIENVLHGRNTLCLMPTGEGKSLCYQVAGLCTGKMTIVISPLRALAFQQTEILKGLGLNSVLIDSGLSGIKQFEILRTCLEEPPQFLMFSVERAANDGYLEFVLQRLRNSIGLVTIDEAHCVSQWGHNFRPAYKEIPDFIDRVFLQGPRPPVLRLTATLSSKDRAEICGDFRIDEKDVFRTARLERTNLKLSTEIFEDELSKLVRLEAILRSHPDEKILVYVHRKRGKYGTSQLAQMFRGKGIDCGYFDADLDTKQRGDVLDAFTTGKTKTVFATGAFGMGVHIPDIRVVVHYLLPESIEQYYQEAGRAGRDRKPSYCYLLFSETNIKVRKDLIREGFPSQEQVATFLNSGLTFQDDGIADLDPWEGLSDENLLPFYYLKKAGVLTVASRGVARLTDFSEIPATPPEFSDLTIVSKSGLTRVIARKKNVPPRDLARKIYEWYSARQVRLARNPAKSLLIRREQELTEKKIAEILSETEENRAHRLAQFEAFTAVIKSTTPLTEAVRDYLELAKRRE
jgi:ATP-dependent DNA helicase RecQ